MESDSDSDNSNNSGDDNHSPDPQVVEAAKVKDTNDKYVLVTNCLNSENLQLQLLACRTITNSSRNQALLQRVTHMIPRLIQLLGTKDQDRLPCLQIAATQALGTITLRSERRSLLVEHGAIEPLIWLMRPQLTFPNYKIAKTAISALRNVSGESSQFRDLLYQKGILPNLITLVETQTNKKFLNDITALIYDLCYPLYGVKAPTDSRMLLPSLGVLIGKTEDHLIISEILWCIIFIFDEESEKEIMEILDKIVIPKLTSFLEPVGLLYMKQKIAFKVLEDMVIGHVDYVEPGVTNKLVLHIFKKLVYNSSTLVGTAWVLKNIAEPFRHRQMQIFKKDLFPLIIDILKSEEPQARLEILQVLKFVSDGNELEPVFSLCVNGIAPILRSLLILYSDNLQIRKTITEIISGIITLLRDSSADDMLSQFIKDCGDFEKLVTRKESRIAPVFQIF